MNNGEKAVVDSFSTENCTKQQYESEQAGLIFICIWQLPGKPTPLNLDITLVYFRAGGKYFYICGGGFLLFLAKPTRSGNTVCGGGQLFFM
jgi:hypothetical protein